MRATKVSKVLARSLAFAEQKDLVDSFSKLSAKLGHLGDTPLAMLQSCIACSIVLFCTSQCIHVYSCSRLTFLK